ncbi:MAG: sugar transferase [Gemmatimonadetes bacterium]|nr:sugar transferase [Gemmatimonadota bacterium]
MKRLLDLLLALVAGIVLAVPAACIALLVRLTSFGPVLYWSDRVGAFNTIFRMPKFRTMRTGTPAVATHLLTNPEAHLTPIGGMLRRTSLDEIPQLWSIIVGDMSFVGPRPALFNQDDLIAGRTTRGIHVLTPGLTGWAQINGRDELAIPEKVRLDEEYLHRQSLVLDLQILWRTFFKVAQGDGVTH